MPTTENRDEVDWLLSLLAQGSLPDPYYSSLIEELGEKIGYGALMHGASAIWRKKCDAEGVTGSEFVVGPCRQTAVKMLEAYRNERRAE